MGEDDPALHVADHRGGAGLCDGNRKPDRPRSAAVEHLARLGVGDRRRTEALALRLEAAHNRNRIVHATGVAPGGSCALVAAVPPVHQSRCSKVGGRRLLVGDNAITGLLAAGGAHWSSRPAAS